MNAGRSKLTRVGIRELRQNLSVYVRRVREEGQAYEVTERGEPVARLTSLEHRLNSTYERMVAEGHITPARAELLDVQPLPPATGAPASEILAQMREHERW